MFVAPARVELARPLLDNRFSYYTCFYTSQLIRFPTRNMFCQPLAEFGYSEGFSTIPKLLQSGPFHYHERNLASWQYTLSSISKHYHLLMLFFYMYTTISLLGISSIVCTPFMKMLNPYISVVCDCYQQYLVYCFPKYNIFNLVRRHQSLCHHKRGFRCN